ncbi:MAG: acyl-CoA dehydrogenase [Betaproteobacteria bacterium]|nr:acyl-CoA dehydrogenase [Betaproteobacteria bacterium]
MQSSLDRHHEIRDAIADLCSHFPDAYHRSIDEARGYPEAFVDALTHAGWLAALIPQEYGGSGLGLSEASVIMEAINRCGGNAGACHGQMYNMGTLLRHGSEAQKRKFLPEIAAGRLRLQSMAVTEPTTGTDTTALKTTARKLDDRYVVNGQKVWISRIQHSDYMILLARTTPLSEVGRKSEGMSIFLVDLHDAIGKGMTVRPIRNMVNHETNELFFENLEIPQDNLIGEEGKGFKYILDGLNAERILIAAEAVGLGRAALARAQGYARERVVFDRPIGQNQAIAHPLAQRWIELEAAHWLTMRAAWLYDQGQSCGAEANSAKFLAAEAGYKACETAVMTHGGMGYAREYHVERYFRESLIPRIAPVSRELILSFIAEKVLGLPKSY